MHEGDNLDAVGGNVVHESIIDDDSLSQLGDGELGDNAPEHRKAFHLFRDVGDPLGQP